MAETMRCKFKLNEVTTRKQYDGKLVYDAKMNAVYSDKPGDPNKAFWDATPGGQFTVSTIKQMPWEIGKEYFIDITPVE
jgi:hypothetical protein